MTSRQDEALHDEPLADSGSGPGANVSPHLKEPAAGTAPHSGSAGPRVGWTSLLQAPNAAHFHGNTRSGRGRAAPGHALGESELLPSPHIARSLTMTRCPWFLSPSNQTLSTAPFPSGMVGRSAEAPSPRSTRKAGFTDGSRPHRTIAGPRSLMSQWPNSTGARCRSGSSSVQHTAWTPGHKAL